MKLREKPSSTQPQIFEHPWYEHVNKLKKPNPPTKEAVKKAQFVDKTYVWKKPN